MLFVIIYSDFEINDMSSQPFASEFFLNFSAELRVNEFGGCDTPKHDTVLLIKYTFYSAVGRILYWHRIHKYQPSR